MKDLTEFIPEILAPLGVETWFQKVPAGTNPPSQYLTFIEYNAEPGLEAADQEITSGRLIQLNVWSKTNYFQLVTLVRELLEENGFDRTAEYDSPYTDGDTHYNKVLRFSLEDDY